MNLAREKEYIQAAVAKTTHAARIPLGSKKIPLCLGWPRRMCPLGFFPVFMHGVSLGLLSPKIFPSSNRGLAMFDDGQT